MKDIDDDVAALDHQGEKPLARHKRSFAQEQDVKGWNHRNFGADFQLLGLEERDEDGWLIEPVHREDASPVPSKEQLLDDFIGAQNVRFEPPHEYAHTHAKDFLMQHLLHEDLDPDEVLITTLYIDEVDREPQRANIAYSMTLTEALMRNWQQSGNGQFLEHLSVLRDYRDGGYPVHVSPTPLGLWDCFAYEAIYRKTSPQRFDRSTHLALDPKIFKQFAWDADLQAHYQSSLTQFWRSHGDNYNLLIRAALLKSAYVQRVEGSLSAEDKALVLRSVGLDPDQAWETLTFRAFADAPLSQTITFRELILYRYVATDIIVIRDEKTDRLVMYIPGNSSPLHGFKDLAELRNWIALQCKGPRRRKSLESHFRIEDRPDGFFKSGIQTTLAGLAAYPHFLNQGTGTWSPSSEIHLGDALSPWPFSHFRQSLQERMASDGSQLIRNRADYNKEAAAMALSNAIVATGAIAMAVPYLWLPLAAMSLALIGLGVDEVVEGRSLEERKAGVGRIVFGVLNAVPAVVEGVVAASTLVGAVARAGQEITPGAADDVGQMIARRSAEQRSVALAKQHEDQAQSAEQALERAGESASQRQNRLLGEEQQKLAMKTQRNVSFEAVAAFGVEPEGLRSLPTGLRAALERFEYTAPLDLSGAWTTDSFGAVFKVSHIESGTFSYFARVHSKIYCVERVEAAGQYRIFSPGEPSVKGPYIKRVKGFYSDIDLRSGLRGGDSYIEVLPATETMPQVPASEIVLVRAQPPVHIEIPMDGIEVRTGTDEWGKQTRKCFAQNVPGGTPVQYDADLACWRKNAAELLWLDNTGTWREGSEEAFMRVRGKLRYGVRSEIYTFPRIPGFPSKQMAIDRLIHQVWVGRKLPSARLIDNIKANMKISPDLKFTLHIDIDDVAISNGLTPQAQLQAQFADFPNMTISNLKDEPFFNEFITHPETAEPFHYFRRGDGENLAAASDVLRYRLIWEYGGIYMDCDDVLKLSFSGHELNAGPADVMVGEPLTSDSMAFFGPGNSHFASRPGNPVLREMQKELYTRFRNQYDTLRDLSNLRAQTVGKFNPYMAKISEVTGPNLFVDVLKKSRPDYADLLDLQIKPRSGVVSLPYSQQVEKAYDFYAPFARRLKIAAGRENSWVTPPG